MCAHVCVVIWHLASPLQPWSSPAGQPAPNDIITLVYCAQRKCCADGFDHCHHLILVQRFCKIRNLEKYLTSIK